MTVYLVKYFYIFFFFFFFLKDNSLWFDSRVLLYWRTNSLSSDSMLVQCGNITELWRQLELNWKKNRKAPILDSNKSLISLPFTHITNKKIIIAMMFCTFAVQHAISDHSYILKIHIAIWFLYSFASCKGGGRQAELCNFTWKEFSHFCIYCYKYSWVLTKDTQDYKFSPKNIYPGL